MSDNKILKIIISAQIVMLVLVVFGVTDSYNFLRWDVLMVTIVLALISLSTRRYYMGAIFGTFAILFNPIDSPSLSRESWIVADISLIVFLLYWSWDFFQNYHKGLQFERFVQKMFPPHEWVLVTYTKDLHKKLQRFVESDADPDFVFRRKMSNKSIAIECKYRSSYWRHPQWGDGILWDKNIGDRYLKYSNKNNTPVCLAIGVGGNPKSPTSVSFLPLEVVQKQYYKVSLWVGDFPRLQTNTSV